MQRSGSKRQRIFWRFLIYGFMTAVVIGATAVLILLTLGYRFNALTGTIRQGGLVHFISQPNGADVMIDEIKLSNKTRSKITLYPGRYLVNMQREGYQAWKKQIDVKAGAVLWLDSALLIPSSPKTSSIYEPKAIASTAFRSDGKFIALVEDAKEPLITVLATDRLKVVEPKVISLPTANYKPAKTHHFELSEWDSDSRHVLVRHQYGKSQEWLVVDTGNPDKPVRLQSDAAEVLFDPRGNDGVIERYSDGAVRTAALTDGKRSGVLVQDAKKIQIQNDNTLTYVTTPKKNIITVGYLTLGAAKGRAISTHPVSDGQKVTAAHGVYFGDHFIATGVGGKVTIEQASGLPPSDSSEPLKLKAIKTISSDQQTQRIGIEGQGRFIVMQQDSDVAVYDLELNRDYVIPVAQATPSSLATPLQWSDVYHFWNTTTGHLRQYEFDGTNQVSIVAVKKGSDAAYSANREVVYTIGDGDKKNHLQATALRVE